MVALADAFKVKVGNKNRPIDSAEVSGASVELTLEDRIAFADGNKIKVTYTPPAEGFLTDLFNNKMAAFRNKKVSNKTLDPSDSTPPTFDEAETSTEGDTISIRFDEDIKRTTIRPEPVRDLAELEAGRRFDDETDPAEYYIDWRWQRGIESQRDAHDYYQYRFRKTSVTAFGDWVIVDEPRADIGDLDPGTEYEIEVQAVNTGGASDSVKDKATTLAALPAGPSPSYVSGPLLHGTPHQQNYNYILGAFGSVPTGTAKILVQYRPSNKLTDDDAWETILTLTTWNADQATSNYVADTYDFRNGQGRARALDTGDNPLSQWSATWTFPDG